jgi:hypothetical protein
MRWILWSTSWVAILGLVISLALGSHEPVAETPAAPHDRTVVVGAGMSVEEVRQIVREELAARARPSLPGPPKAARASDGEARARERGVDDGWLRGEASDPDR